MFKIRTSISRGICTCFFSLSLSLSWHVCQAHLVSLPVKPAMVLSKSKIGRADQKAKKKAHFARAPARSPSRDPDYLESRVQSLLNEISQRPLRLSKPAAPLESKLDTQATKSAWLKQIYSLNLVEASKLTELMSDKLLQYKIFSSFLKERRERFLLHSMGLKEFLVKHHLVAPNGEIAIDPDTIENALADEFPTGFVVRPSLGIAPGEKSQGLFANSDEFIKDLLKKNSRVYQADTLYQPIKSHIINEVASGEAIILQEDVTRSLGLKQKLHIKSYERVRVHSFEGQVVADAIPELWVTTRAFKIGAEQNQKIEKYVQEFLDQLPPTLTTRQAWGIDVAVLDNGEMKILDVVTNRGLKIAWSSYLEEPKVLGAYSRHFEQNCDLQFTGLAGFLIRHDLANYLSYWQARREKTSTRIR